MVLIYLYETYKNKNIFTSNKKSKKIENNPKINKLIDSLKEFKKFNKDAVNGSLKHLSNFFTMIILVFSFFNSYDFLKFCKTTN